MSDTSSNAPSIEGLVAAALRLLAQMTKHPERLRVQAGEHSIDVDWRPARSASPSASASPEPSMVSASVAAAMTSSAFAPAPATDTLRLFADDESGLDYICAPMVGTFYHAPSPEAPPFVSVGDTVASGQQVGIVEAMKLMVPIEAVAHGRIVKAFVDNGEPVEYGQHLFAFAPA